MFLELGCNNMLQVKRCQETVLGLNSVFCSLSVRFLILSCLHLLTGCVQNKSLHQIIIVQSFKMAAELCLPNGLHTCVCVCERLCTRPGSKEHSCVLAGDMLIATDINLKNISRSNMCLRLHLQPSEQKGTECAHVRAHTHTHTHACRDTVRENGSGRRSKRISETACHLRCPQKTTD